MREMAAFPDAARVLTALREFQTHRTQMALVIGEHGQALGIVTVEDLVEELVGEIYDETDPDLATVIREPDSTLVIPGAFPVHDLVDLDVELPEGDYTTISGLVLDELGRFPTIGETIEIEGWQIEIRAIHRHRIEQVALRQRRVGMSTIMDLPAVLGGTPVRQHDYPSWPVWDEHERAGLLGVLDAGGWWQGDGNEAATFAQEFATYHGARFGMAFTNGTHTIEAALAACDIGEGDEVIVPAMTFVASASAALAVNATPILVDVDPDTLCIDVEAARARSRRARERSLPSTSPVPPPTSMRSSRCAPSTTCG